MKLTKPLFAPACIAVALMLLLAPLANAQVLQQVPADALVVIKFSKLRATSDKIAAMMQKLGIAQFQPDTADPLGSMKREMKIQNGLDEAGEAAIVVANTSMEGRQPPILVYVPVTDYKAFVANFQNAKTAGAVTTVNFGGNDTGSIVNWGKYAVISPRPELVANKPSMVGLQPTGLSAKELDSKDIVAYANMKVARTRILPEIAKARDEFIKNFERGYMRSVGGQQPPARRAARPGAPAPAPAPAAAAAGDATGKYMPVMKAFFTRLFDVAEGIIRDSDAAAWGVAIADDGVKFTALADFSASSASAQKVASFKGSDKSVLTGLPATKYMAFGGGAGDPAATGKLIAEFLTPIEAEVAKLGSDGKPIQAYIDSIKKYVSATRDSASGWIQPQGALGQEAIIQVVSVSSGDAKTLLAAQKEMFNSQQAFMDMFSPPQMRGQMKSSFTENAKTVDGVQLNLMQSQFGAPAGGQQSPQMMQMKQMMTWMYGPNGIQAYVGALGNDKIVMLMGVPEAKLATAIAAAKANQDVLSSTPGVQAVNAQLPKTRCFAAYIAVDNIASTVANYAKMFGMPINFQLPADLPPIGITLGSEGSALRADYYVPAQLVQSVIAAGIQSYMQMQGGQQPGGPGGL